MIIQIPTRCSFLCSFFDGKTLHVSSVTRSSPGVQKLCLQPGVVFNYFWFCFFCYVLYLYKVLWFLDWYAMVVLLVVCAVGCGVIHYLHCVDTWLQTQFLNSWWWTNYARNM